MGKILEGMLLGAKEKALRKYFSFNTMKTNEVWGPLGRRRNLYFGGKVL